MIAFGVTAVVAALTQTSRDDMKDHRHVRMLIIVGMTTVNEVTIVLIETPEDLVHLVIVEDIRDLLVATVEEDLLRVTVEEDLQRATVEEELQRETVEEDLLFTAVEEDLLLMTVEEDLDLLSKKIKSLQKFFRSVHL